MVRSEYSQEGWRRGSIPLPLVPAPGTFKFSIWLFHRTVKGSAPLCVIRIFWLAVFNIASFNFPITRVSLVALRQRIHLPSRRRVQSLGWEDPLEEEMVAHYSVRHNLMTK